MTDDSITMEDVMASPLSDLMSSVRDIPDAVIESVLERISETQPYGGRTRILEVEQRRRHATNKKRPAATGRTQTNRNEV